jgi:hypothetical protein
MKARRDGATPPGALLWVVLGLACLLGLAAIVRHEWWRDEAYTLLVVRESTSLADLCARLGFNGHPRAYYVLCYALCRIWPSPIALSGTNLALALLAIALFLHSAPFPPLHKALFALGFFPLYQYGVITRSYSVFLFLLFLYAHLRVRWPHLVAWRLVCLALLAQVHLMSLACAAVLLLLELHERRSGAVVWSKRAWLGAAALVMSLACTAYQILPRGHQPASRSTNADLFFAGLANGFFPHFDRLRGMGQAVLGMTLFVLSWLVLRRDRGALLRYALLALPLAALSALIYYGHRWHHGFYFVYFVVAVWLSGAPSQRCLRFLGAVLALHAAVGAYALAADLGGPYSNGKDVARAIEEQDLGRLPLVGVEVQPGTSGELRYVFQIDSIQPVLLYLKAGRAYNPRAATRDAYWSHYAEPAYFAPMSASELVVELREIAKRLGAPMVVVTVEGAPLHGAEIAPPPLRRLATFERPLDYGEALGLYLFPLD